jgi:membrane associated rhomboid family serine protease
VLVFLAQQASASFEDHFVLIGQAFDPTVGHQVGVADGEYYRLLTAAFMHASIFHIAFNMYALYLFGPPLEATLGRVRYLSLYLMSALGGSAVSYAFNAPNQGSLGASGAVFGLFGAFFIVNRKFGRDNSGLLVLLAINLAFAFLPGTNIDWHAHVGGLLTGSLVASALVYAPRDKRTVVQAAGSVVVLLIIVALVVWRTAQLT